MVVHLTRAEVDIVRKLLEGMRNKEIAAARNTSVQVIKNQLRMIYDKTGMDSRLELALAAMAHPEWLVDWDEVKASFSGIDARRPAGDASETESTQAIGRGRVG